MASPAQTQIPASRSSACEVLRLVEGLVLRLKSWKPPSTQDLCPVALGVVTLPSTVGEVIAGPPKVFCTGPGELLLIDERMGAARVAVQEFEREARAQGLAVADLSHGLVGFALNGASAADVLARGCGVDFHGRSFPAGRCVRTRLAQIPVVILRLEASAGFELYAPRSYLHYLSDWLHDASMQ